VDGQTQKIPPNSKNRAVKLMRKHVMKSQRLRIFLSICLLIFYGNSFGQKNTQNFYCLVNNPPDRPQFWRSKCLENTDTFKPEVGISFRQQGTHSSFERLMTLVKSPDCILPPGYYVNSLGLVCRQERKLDKISPVPLRLRLGSLDYVNYLEQKPNSSNIW
jgi:hypothetical protein